MPLIRIVGLFAKKLDFPQDADRRAKGREYIGEGPFLEAVWQIFYMAERTRAYGHTTSVGAQNVAGRREQNF